MCQIEVIIRLKEPAGQVVAETVTVHSLVDILHKDVVGPETQPRDLLRQPTQVASRADNACGSSTSRSQAVSAPPQRGARPRARGARLKPA
jgi:hypothetical protein